MAFGLVQSTPTHRGQVSHARDGAVTGFPASVSVPTRHQRVAHAARCSSTKSGCRGRLTPPSQAPTSQGGQGQVQIQSRTRRNAIWRAFQTRLEWGERGKGRSRRGTRVRPCSARRSHLSGWPPYQRNPNKPKRLNVRTQPGKKGRSRHSTSHRGGVLPGFVRAAAAPRAQDAGLTLPKAALGWWVGARDAIEHDCESPARRRHPRRPETTNGCARKPLAAGVNQAWLNA